MYSSGGYSCHVTKGLEQVVREADACAPGGAAELLVVSVDAPGICHGERVGVEAQAAWVQVGEGGGRG